MSKQRPWTDINGNRLTEREIEQRSQHWTLKEWELFQAKGMNISPTHATPLGSAEDIEEFFSDQKSIWDFVSDGHIPQEYRELLPNLKEALANLNSRELAVLKEFYLNEKTIKEVAKLLNLKFRTAQSRKRVAIGKIKNALKKDLCEKGSAIGISL